MPRIRYTADQLLALQDSPLIRRPDNLPRIESWIDLPAERNQNRPRTQNGKAEDIDTAPKQRPSLFETRAMSRHSQTGEDIFLGPKMSFASASAARQSAKATRGEDLSTRQDDGRRTFDRFKQTKENETRERDVDKPKLRQNHRANAEDDTENDGRHKRVGDFTDRRKEQRDGEVAPDGANGRSNGTPRAKLDHPWFRSSDRIDNKEGEQLDGNGDRAGWRDRERNRISLTREIHRDGKEPQWMKDPAPEDVEHTPDDFAKWKERMKAGSSANEGGRKEAETGAAQGFEDRSTFGTGLQPKPSDTPQKMPEGGLFGIWGGPKKDAEVATPKAALPKSSRFAGFFAPKEQEAPPPQEEPAALPVAAAQPPQPKDEDQQGFQRMMQMLRLGGTASQGPQQQSVQPPPSREQQQPSQAAADFLFQGRSSIETNPRDRNMPPVQTFEHGRDQYQADVDSRAQLVSPEMQPNFQHQPQPRHRDVANPPVQRQLQPQRQPSLREQPQQHQPRPAPVAQASERDFLLKLMQQPRASPAFNEGQIYGQNYHSRSSNTEVNSLLNSFASRPSETKARGPPPGFPPADNGHAFRSNGAINMGPMSPEDRLPTQQRTSEDHYRAQMSPYEQGGVFNRQSEPKPQDIRPPPGFSNGPPHGMRQGPPPGFPAYLSQQQQQQGPPQHQHPPQPPPQHQLPPQQQMRAVLPPGFPPPMIDQRQPQYMPHQPQQPQQQPQQRRLTNPPMGVNVPPGYEGYGDMARRGPVNGYAPPYLDQRTGRY